jgi:hypothetical protein
MIDVVWVGALDQGSVLKLLNEFSEPGVKWCTLVFCRASIRIYNDTVEEGICLGLIPIFTLERNSLLLVQEP